MYGDFGKNPDTWIERIITIFVNGKWFEHNDIKEHIVDGEEMMKKFEDIEEKYSSLDG